jgi:hypothetical protein
MVLLVNERKSKSTAAPSNIPNEKRSSEGSSSSMILVTVLRGPLLVGVAICSLLYPYLLEHKDYLSTNLLAHVGIVMVGVFCFCHDLYTVSERGLRCGINRLLDRTVVDDVLRAIYDPTTGLVACSVASFVGASSMYGLSMNTNQRIRLVQSSLNLNSEEDAHTLLMEPGGCRILLPGTVRGWLLKNSEEASCHSQCKEEEEERKPSGSSSRKGLESSCPQPPPGGTMAAVGSNRRSVMDHGSEISTSDCDVADILDHEDDDDSSLDSPTFEATSLRNATRGRSFGDDGDLGSDAEHEQEQQPHTTSQRYRQPPMTQQRQEADDPLTVYLRILKDLAMERIRPHVEAFPHQSVLENVGTASIGALAVQLFLRRNSKSAPSPLATLSAWTLSSIATLSFGAIVSRQTFLGTIHDGASLQRSCNEIAVRVWHRLKGKLRTRQSKAFVAMLVLFMIGRRKLKSKHA